MLSYLRKAQGLWILLTALMVAPTAHAAEELFGPEKLTSLTWSYSLGSLSLQLTACGRYRPGELEQCAKGVLKEGPLTGRNIDRTLEMLRLPRDKLGVVLVETKGQFEIVALSAELLIAPGIGERAARPPTVELSGESLTQILWIHRLSTRSITLRVCGKTANPDRTDCAEHVETSSAGVRRMRELLLLGPVEQLGFLIGWDGKKFTKLKRIASPSSN